MPSRVSARAILTALLSAILILTGCAPTPEANVAGYLLARRLGTLMPSPDTASGAVTGQVLADDGLPLANATVLVAERTGTPHVAQTDAAGRYVIRDVPPGQYVPAAVAPTYDEVAATDALGIPRLVTVRAGQTAAAPLLRLTRHVPAPLPEPLAAAVQLTQTSAYTATAPFPANAVAQVYAYQYVADGGLLIDSLRVYLPLNLPTDRTVPLLFMVYPTAVDDWETVSVGFAAAGFGLVALSPHPARGVDIDAHAQDARIAFALARTGSLHPALARGDAVVLGGSFSSPILHRFLRDERDHVAAWVTVGGISDALTGAADFYAGKLELSPQYELLVPALGAPNVYPLLFLRYSPVYTAVQLPPTLIIHTAADKVTPIDQAYELEAALRRAHVPVAVYYYQDVSHYLQVGDALSDAGRTMFDLIVAFAQTYQSIPPYTAP